MYTFPSAAHRLVLINVIFNVLSFIQRSQPPEFLSPRCHMERGDNAFMTSVLESLSTLMTSVLEPLSISC